VNAATWVVRVALAIVFAMAGGAKLADQAGARRTVAGFGIPGRFTAGGADLVIVLELAIALGLLLPTTATAAAAGALVLLGVFLAGLSLQLARGVKVPCACFGTLTTTPAGWPTLARNALLAAAAVFLLFS